MLLGGVLVRRFDLKTSLKMAARFLVIASMFTVIGSSAWFIPGCGVPDVAGITTPYKNRLDPFVPQFIPVPSERRNDYHYSSRRGC